MASDEPMILARITITREFSDDSDNIGVEATDEQGNLPTLIEMLGMLDIARDTVYRMSAGEFDEDVEEGEDDEGE